MTSVNFHSDFTLIAIEFPSLNLLQILSDKEVIVHICVGLHLFTAIIEHGYGIHHVIFILIEIPILFISWLRFINSFCHSLTNSVIQFTLK
jgi:hypothetical protein